MDRRDAQQVTTVTVDDVRRVEAGETVSVGGYPLTRDLIAATAAHPYDYEPDGRLKEIAVGVIAQQLSRLVHKHADKP